MVFLAIFFSGTLFNVDALVSSVLAFLALSLVSSGMYALNDVIDAEKDKLHPKKKHRPIPSGRVSKQSATIFSFFLLAVGFLIALKINLLVLFFALALFLNTLIYSFFFKHVPFADVADLSLNFLIRTLAGVYAINAYPSYWIIVVPYFLALLLATFKRYGEIERGSKGRKVISFYSKEVLRSLAAAIVVGLLLLYLLYIHSSPTLKHKTIVTLATLPIAAFVLFRWYGEALSNPDMAEEAFHMVKDRVFLGGLLIWALILLWSIYS